MKDNISINDKEDTNEKNEETACICTCVCNDHYDLSATSAYAATKKPVLSVKSIALQVGKQKTLKVKNAGKNATIQWSSSKKTVATSRKKAW